MSISKYDYKRILTVQDISCVGQCSLTVALPILSACGVETAVIPSAVLSTHTAGFKGFTFRDLTGDMPLILEHWLREGIKFDGMYTGYLGSETQIDYCIEIAAKTLKDGALLIVDPAMADNGVLYKGFDNDFVKAMRKLVGKADLAVPNLTEACFLTGNDYRETYDKDYIRKVCADLLALGAKKVVLTGIGFEEGFTGVFVSDGRSEYYYRHEKLPGGCHGTGDVYASAFSGALMRGKTVEEAAAIAADYTVLCIKNTMGDKDHWYGVKFEPVLPALADMLK
ncbi:MAG: pyridoxamine kinase [Clostridia bacterium]|nr:pyridoxamine kinase [Clostridia bacterium]MCR5693609.1 pyridoxamine kinase [Clostridia bacterium]